MPEPVTITALVKGKIIGIISFVVFVIKTAIDVSRIALGWFIAGAITIWVFLNLGYLASDVGAVRIIKNIIGDNADCIARLSPG
jgi:hypothetical protein